MQHTKKQAFNCCSSIKHLILLLEEKTYFFLEIWLHQIKERLMIQVQLVLANLWHK